MSAPRISWGSSGSPGKFVFYVGMFVSTVLPSLVPPRHIDDCFAIHVLHWEFCDPLCKMFRSGHDCTSTSSARSPCYFCLQAAITNWVLRKVHKEHCAYPDLLPLLLAAPLEIHETNWKGFDFLALGFLQSSSEVLSSTKFSINSCSQSGNSCDISPCTSSDASFFILVFNSCGFIQRVSPKLSIRTSTSFWYWSFNISVFSIGRYWLLWRRWWRGRWRCRWGGTRR